MKKVLYLIGLLAIFFLQSCDSNENEFEFDIWCSCKINKKPLSCEFYAFPEDEYIGVVLDDSYGTAYAILKDGSKVENVGYAFYSENEGKYATLSDYKNPSGLTPIREGTFYIACFPLQIGYRHPYKADIFTKTKDKGLVIEPIFTEKSYYGVDGYQRFEWDE